MAAFIPTTIEEWAALRQDIKHAATLTRSPSQTIELRICAIVTFMSGLLYGLSFLKRRSSGAWIFKKDGEEYWHPNVHTTLPICAVLYVILDVSAVICVEMNLGHPIDPLPVALQLVAYQILQVFALLKIWAVLYAVLCSQQRAPMSATHPSSPRRLVSPRVFNLFNTLVIVIVVVGQLPLIVFLCLAIEKFRHQASATDLSFQLALDVSLSDDANALYDAALQTFVDMRHMKQQVDKANMLFKIYTIFITVLMSFNILVYLVSTSFLLHALRSQKNFLVSALKNRKALKLIQQIEQEEIDSRHSITSWIIRSYPSSPTSPNHDTSKSKPNHKSFDPWTWRSWVDFANDESLDGHVFWNRINQLNIPSHASKSTCDSESQLGDKNSPLGCPNDAALEKHCSTLIRYWYSTLGQTIVGLGMFLSYLVMAGWLLSRWSHSTGQDELIRVFVWSNWTWGGGSGLMLGIVACVVAFSSTPTLPSDTHAKKAASSRAKLALPPKKGVSSGYIGAEPHEGGPLEMKMRCAPKTTTQKGRVEALPGRVLKPSHHDDNLSITNSEWCRPSTDLNRAENSESCLVRQPSNSSTYSSTSHATVPHDFPRNGSNTRMDWLKIDNLLSEDLEEEEWVGGHFKAIQRLRAGETRFSRSSKRARSQIL